MFGAISAELWGHLGSEDDLERLYEATVRHWIGLLLPL
jgi:hypothetical protein